MSRLAQLALLHRRARARARRPARPETPAQPAAGSAARPRACSAPLLRANSPKLGAADLAFIDRVTWGVNESTAAEFLVLGRDRWLERQLHPGREGPAAAPPPKPPIAAMPIATQPVTEIAWPLTAQQRTANQIQDPEQRKTGQQA